MVAYYETVSQLSKLESPQRSYLKRLRQWLTASEGGMKDGVFEHLESWVWGDQNDRDHRGEQLRQDFVTMAPPKVERDYLTQSIIYPLISVFHHVWGKKSLDKRNVLDIESGLVEYDEEKID